MNTLSHLGESCDFSTVAELLATPLVQRYVGFSHIVYDKGSLWAYDGKALCLIGRLKEPVRIPAQVSLAQDQ